MTLCRRNCHVNLHKVETCFRAFSDLSFNWSLTRDMAQTDPFIPKEFSHCYQSFSATPDLGLHLMHLSHKKDASRIWVTYTNVRLGFKMWIAILWLHLLNFIHHFLCTSTAFIVSFRMGSQSGTRLAIVI